MCGEPGNEAMTKCELTNDYDGELHVYVRADQLHISTVNILLQLALCSAVRKCSPSILVYFSAL